MLYVLNSSHYFHEYVAELRSVQDVIEIHGIILTTRYWLHVELDFFFLFYVKK
jgi:hypothetical protein